jgi:hypothetical protein
MSRSTLEQIADSLDHLNQRIDKEVRAQRARNDAAEAAARARARADAYEDRIVRQARFASFQSRIDDVLQPFGLRAPSPAAGESARSYKSRLLRLCQDQLPSLDREIDVGGGTMANVKELATFPLLRCDDAVIDVMSKQIQGACKALAFDPASVPKGETRVRHIVDPLTGMRTTHFVGDESAGFVHDFTRRGRRVERIQACHEGGPPTVLYEMRRRDLR